MMDVFEAIKIRRSIRKYLQESIPDNRLEMIFEAARLAPSASNRQPWRFIVVRDANRKKALAGAANNQTFLSDAAAVVAAVGDPDVSTRWHERDPMIALEHMALATAALGYGTCWIGAFDETKVLTILCNPKDLVPVAIIPIGYPAEKPEPTSRRELSHIVHES